MCFEAMKVVYFRVLMRLCLELGKLLVRNRQWPDDHLFLWAVYKACLKREPDADGKEFYLNALRSRRMSRLDVVKSVISSYEFRQVYRLSTHPLDAIHQARMMLVQQCLPPAQVIVDLGGAAPGHPEGALLLMGYPHQPKLIIIVDVILPENKSWITSDGICIRYYKGSMVDIRWIESDSVDLVWAGESIEHITEDEFAIVCKEVFRILKPNGSFCLDTPNAALTRLQSPDRLIHPEHKREYYVHEVENLLKRSGFIVVEAKGICPMPSSLQRGVFDPEELVRNIRLSEYPEEGYLFYLRAIKPGNGFLNEVN